MAAGSTGQLRRFPLHDRHQKQGAKFGAFGEWEVPLYYTSLLEEHEAVRQSAGLFDISHMGEFWAEGQGALAFLESLLPRKISKIQTGRAQYMPLLNEKGGILDDLIVYRAGESRYWIIVNAANIQHDFEWMKARAQSLNFEDRSEAKGLLALQGPKSEAILERWLQDSAYTKLPYYGFGEWKSGLIARTGYTGEDGFEIMVEKSDLPEVWDGLMKSGAREGLRPVGFGARDTLRLEAGMLLHGHDMNESTTPLEAGIAWAVDFSKDTFTGKEVLQAQQAAGPSKKLVGFEVLERGIAREGYDIQAEGNKIGSVTSGTFAPTLKKNIGLGYVESSFAGVGQALEIMIRQKPVRAQVVKRPFYQRAK